MKNHLPVFALLIVFLASCSEKNDEARTTSTSENPGKTEELISETESEKMIVLKKGCTELAIETDKQLSGFQKNLLADFQFTSKEALKRGFSKVITKSDIENVESVIEFRKDKSYIRYYSLSSESKVLIEAEVSEKSFPIYKNLETGLSTGKFLQILETDFGVDRNKMVSECLEFIPLSEYEFFTFRMNGEKLLTFEYESTVEFF